MVADEILDFAQEQTWCEHMSCPAEDLFHVTPIRMCARIMVVMQTMCAANGIVKV